MRPEGAPDGGFVWARAALLAVGGAVLGAAAFGRTAALAGAALGVGIGLVLRQRARQRQAGRRTALAGPFPQAWRELLRERYDHFERLPADRRSAFEDDIRIFLAEKSITGVEVEVTHELRLLVAASAVTLSLGWPSYEWDQLTEVLLYPDDFDRDYNFGGNERVGEAHAWGSIILSVPALYESFEDPADGYHVGLHEFAHLLDVAQTRFDGIPGGLDPRRSANWVVVAEKEMERLRRGKSVLDPYGGEDAVEFFAVSVEAFFEMPLALRHRHRELYALLADYFGQDPAAWDDQRGYTV